jgi:hypothetical protein
LKSLLLLCVLIFELFAFDSVTASKIFDKIFHAMINKEKLSVYTKTKIYQDVILDSEHLQLSSSAETADIILVSHLNEIPKNSNKYLLFSTSYLVYENNENTVGAFYWDRGHIKIEFSRKRLQNKKIKLPNSFNKYIKDDL